MTLKSLVFLLPLVFLFACNNANSDEGKSADTADTAVANVSKEVFQPGTLIPKVNCSTDPRFSYALYLPKTYNGKEFWPVIIFFDPHAAGHLPVKKYQVLADRYGFILAGSNESKNGMEGSVYPDISEAIARDIDSRFKLAKNQLYLSGFSGGARVAISIAVADETVAGVIANSAGFDPGKSPIKESFVIAGIAGTYDFNWLEQQRTERSLGILPVRHCFLEFDGKHEWAPVETMEEAMVFLYCSAVAKGQKVKYTDSLTPHFEKAKVKLKSGKKATERYTDLKRFVAVYDGAFEIAEYKAGLEELEKSSAIKKWINEREDAEAKEAVLQNTYYEKVFSESVQWWDEEVKRMKSVTGNTEAYRMNQRVLSYVSLAVYMTIISPQAQRDMLALEKFIAIYSVVDPQNPEWAYQKSILRAKQGNKKEAGELLLKSIEMGFNDKERVKAEVLFSEMMNDPKVQDFLNN